MRAVYALVFVAGGVAAADEKVAPEPLKVVEGDCVLTGFEGKGVKLTKDEAKKLPYTRRDVVVTGNTIVAEFGGAKKETRTFKVDNTKTPHHIDLTSTDKDGKTETNYGIYKIEKGILTICATEFDKPEARPTEFKVGRDTFLMTIRKRHELEGTYLLTGLEAKGLKLDESTLKKVPDAERVLIIDDDQILSMFNGKEDAATFKLDNTKNPRHIDLVTTRDNKSETNHGIYTFQDGTLTLCVSEKGDTKDRPTEIKADEKTVVFRLKLQPRK